MDIDGQKVSLPSISVGRKPDGKDRAKKANNLYVLMKK